MNLSTANLALLLSVFALVIAVFSFFYFKSYLRRRTGQERILSEMREEVNGILKSIDETADRDISVFEEKERGLKSLLAEIEKRHKVYVRDMEKHRESDEAYAALQQKKPAGAVLSGRVQPSYQELGKNPYRVNASFAAESMPSKEAAAPAAEEKTGAPLHPGPAFPLPSFSVSNETGSASMREQIHSLVRAGFSAPIIASRLGLSIAEVEFAAALLERRDAQ